MIKAAIVHGTLGSPVGNWFPWLAGELNVLGVRTIVPAMPTPENQSLINWRAAFLEQVGELDESSILIGHSVGALFLLRLLERMEQRIACTVLVAPLIGDIGNPTYDKLNSSFLIGAGFNWQNVRSKGGSIHIFCGENDPYVPLIQPLEVAKQLEINPNIIKNGGHLNSEAGFNSFELLLEHLYLLPEIVAEKRSFRQQV